MSLIEHPEFRVNVGVVDPRNYGADKTAADNTAAFQAAMDFAHATANGGRGTMLIPPGVFNFTGQLLYHRDVDLQGFGENVSILQWPSNTPPGTGPYARHCMDFSGQGYGGWTGGWRHFQIRGPSGASTSNVCGPRVYGYSISLEHLYVQGFKWALCNNGDHGNFYKVQTNNCWGGLVYTSPKITGGDNTYTKCRFEGALAGIVFERDGIAGGDCFFQCGISGAIGIYQTDQTYDGSNLAYSGFFGCSFEHCSNGVLLFENGALKANNQSDIVAVRFLRCALELTADLNTSYPGDGCLMTAHGFTGSDFGDVAGGRDVNVAWWKTWTFRNNTITTPNQLLASTKPIVVNPDFSAKQPGWFVGNKVGLKYGYGRLDWFQEPAVAGDLQEMIAWDTWKGVRKARAGSVVPAGVAVRNEAAGTGGLLQTNGYLQGVTQDAAATTGALVSVSPTEDGKVRRTNKIDGSEGVPVGQWGKGDSGQTIVYLTLAA